MESFLKGVETIWLLGKGNDLVEYAKNGAVTIVPDLSLMEARNYALNDAFSKGETCCQVSDDLVKSRAYIFDQTDFDRSKYGVSHAVMKEKPQAALKDICEELMHPLGFSGFKLGGISPTTNQMSLRNKICNKHFILGDLFVCLPTDLRFDMNMTLKEDYDFTLQHVKEYGGVVRADYIYAQFGHKTAGGVKDIRSEEREQQNISYLKEKWGKYPEAVKDSPTRKNEIRINCKKIT